MDIVVRAGADPAPVIGAIRRHVHAMDPDVPIMNLRPMTECVSGRPRFDWSEATGYRLAAAVRDRR